MAFDPRYPSPLAAELGEAALSRFLRYVVIDTQSSEGSDTYPSTAKQLDLSRVLVEELKEIGLEDARLDEHGYVMATLPATVEHEVPTLGLIAHVDTSPQVTGANVKPQLVRDYDGGVGGAAGQPAPRARSRRAPRARAPRRRTTS